MTPDTRAVPATVTQLEREWARAAAAAIRAERAYHSLLDSDETGDRRVARAWLVLWRAEARQREIEDQLARLDPLPPWAA